MWWINDLGVIIGSSFSLVWIGGSLVGLVGGFDHGTLYNLFYGMVCLVASLMGRQRNILGGLLLITIPLTYLIWMMMYLKVGSLRALMVHFMPFIISGTLFVMSSMIVKSNTRATREAKTTRGRKIH